MARALDSGVDFLCTFPQKEQAAGQQDQILYGHVLDMMHERFITA